MPLYRGPSGGDVSNVLSAGEVLADDGNSYDTIQAAEDAADSFIWIGPGTFNEAVTVDTAGLTIVGSGRGTVIDGGATGTALTITANNVEVARLAVQTTAGQGNNFDGIDASGNRTRIHDAVVIDSDRDGIRISGTDQLVHHCLIESADNQAVNDSGATTPVVDGNLVV